MAKLDRFIGRPVFDRKGAKIGTLEDFYRDDRTGRTLWLKVKTRWFGRHSSFVTVEGSEPQGENVVIGVDHRTVRHAPVAGRDGPLSVGEDAELKAYYATRVGSRRRRSTPVSVVPTPSAQHPRRS